MLIGAKELGQTATVQVGIGIDAVRRLHEVTDTTEELLLGSEVFLGLGFQLLDALLLLLLTLFHLGQQAAVFLKECLVMLMRTPQEIDDKQTDEDGGNEDDAVDDERLAATGNLGLLLTDFLLLLHVCLPFLYADGVGQLAHAV